MTVRTVGAVVAVVVAMAAAAGAAPAAQERRTSTAVAQSQLCDPDWYRGASPADVQREIQNGASVNQTCRQGSSPLLLALRNDARADVILLLMRQGAHLDFVNRFDTRGQSPAMLIDEQCERGRMNQSVCQAARQGFEARVEAHRNGRSSSQSLQPPLVALL